MSCTKAVGYRSWNDLPVVMSLGQCAVILNITYTTALKWAKDGTIPAVKVGDKWCVDKLRLKAMLEGHEEVV